MEEFYQTMSGLCFTLLGLWWAIIQFRHEEWMSDPNQRRLAFSVHLSFVVPGLMSLVAMLSTDLRIIWQATFVIAGLLGLVAGVLAIRSIHIADKYGWAFRYGRWFGVLLYGVVIIFAIAPELATSLFGLKGLLLEGILLSLLVLLSVSYAWEFLAEPKEKSAE